jgi:hypothetical protein
MAQVQVDLSEYEELTARLERLPRAMQGVILTRAANAVGVALDDVAKGVAYPPDRRPIPMSRWATAKQKRWWWYTVHAIAKGEKSSNVLPGYRIGYKQVRSIKTQNTIKVLDIRGFYRRSNTLIKSLTYVVEVAANAVSGAVTLLYGTAIKYAKYVIGGADEQAQYHAGNWLPLVGLIERYNPVLAREYTKAVDKSLTEYLEGGTND